MNSFAHKDTSTSYGPTIPGRFYYRAGDCPLEGVTIKRAVGRGGFGEVYFAVTEGGKQIALKHITRGVEVERRGAIHCMNLKSPNLIELYDIRSNPEGATFILMEYVAGQSLKELIERHPTGVPVKRVKTLMKGLINGVAELHAVDIVHRDLKPANIFVHEESVKVGDYGLSKAISDQDADHSVSVGTCHYMAPEIRSGKYEKSVDIYALGAILYELLTGHPPFQGETVGEILMRHQFDAPDPDPVPPAFRPIVMRMLSKNPAERPKDLQAVAQWIEFPESHSPEFSSFERSSETTHNSKVDHVTNSKHLEQPDFFATLLRGTKTFRLPHAIPTDGSSQKPAGRKSRITSGGILVEAPKWPTDRIRKKSLISSVIWTIILCWLTASPIGFLVGVNMSEAPNRIAFIAVSSAMLTTLLLVLNYLWEGWSVTQAHRSLVGIASAFMLGLMFSILAVWLNIENRPTNMNRPINGLFNSPVEAVISGWALYYVTLLILILAVPRWWTLVARDRPVKWSTKKTLRWVLWSFVAIQITSLVSDVQITSGIPMASMIIAGILTQFVSTWDQELAEYRELHYLVARKTR